MIHISLRGERVNITLHCGATREFMNGLNYTTIIEPAEPLADRRGSAWIIRHTSASMRHVVPKLLLCVTALTLAGCATPSYFKPMTDAPSDKALVYIYRKYNYIGSGAAHKIYVDKKPITLLYVDNYYPYLADPGNVTFTVKEVLIGEAHLFDFMIPKTVAADINVEAAKTYYLKFDVPSALTFKMRYSLVDPEVGEIQITNCVLAASLTK